MIPALLCLSILVAVLWYVAKRRKGMPKVPNRGERYSAWAGLYFSLPEYQRSPPTRIKLPKRKFPLKAKNMRRWIEKKLPKDNVVQLRRVAK